MLSLHVKVPSILYAIDTKGRLCGACTTSGMSLKLHGRVGDSPIIGAGLYVDGEVGGDVSNWFWRVGHENGSIFF